MTKKQQRVPGTHATKPNREQRRHPDGPPQDHPLARDTESREMNGPDVPAKNSAAVKRTANK
jgi:hypothetical protein